MYLKANDEHCSNIVQQEMMQKSNKKRRGNKKHPKKMKILKENAEAIKVVAVADG